MDAARFWTLIDLLEGVADERSVAVLESQLGEEEAEPFLSGVEERVASLLQRCRVPASHDGDAAEWLAAAVLAAGRGSYEATRAAGGTLDPDAWRWRESEALLVAGFAVDVEVPDDDQPHPGFVLQWLTERLPPSVSSSWRPLEPVLPPGVDPEDPGLGHVPATDPAWDAAREALQDDPGVARARQELGQRYGVEWDGVQVWVTLRDGVDEPSISVWPPADPEVADLVLVGTVAADELRGLTGPDRTAAYLELVTGLLQVVLEDG